MSIYFLIFFMLFSGVHLYASIKCNKVLRGCTKGFILLSLLGWYYCFVDHPEPIVMGAILTSWLGDVLLIVPGVKWFSFGGISFMISHICFIIAYSKQVDFSSLTLLVIVLPAMIYTIIVYFVLKGLKKYLMPILVKPMFFYLLVNGAMNCFAFYRFASNPSIATLITFIGATQFMISDSSLFYVRFSKNSPFKTHFFVMLTYILAELLIVVGLALE